MTSKDDSKELWLELRRDLPKYDVHIGTATGQSYIHDPKHIVFVLARYKFAAKMLAGRRTVLEVGCCDAFGAPVVAQSVSRLICTDIDDEIINENIARRSFYKNIEFHYHDFRLAPYPDRVDAVFHIDVIEHIFPSEQESFMSNQCKSINDNGIMLIGTPNAVADQYASEHSRRGHVNLKDSRALCEVGERYFHNVFLFSMNDEVVHTGFSGMAHYLWALCVGPRAV